MNQGAITWMTPNGDGPRNHPLLKDLHLPPLGNMGRPVALPTKTLLFVADSSNAVMGGAGISGPAKFRAYDKLTGKVIAELDLPVGATGGPMTYLQNGRQLIVVPVGGKGYGAGWVALVCRPLRHNPEFTSPRKLCGARANTGPSARPAMESILQAASMPRH